MAHDHPEPVQTTVVSHVLRWIGPERLAVMGYDLDIILEELDQIPGSGQRLGMDLLKNGRAWSKRVGRERAAALLWQRRPR